MTAQPDVTNLNVTKFSNNYIYQIPITSNGVSHNDSTDINWFYNFTFKHPTTDAGFPRKCNFGRTLELTRGMWVSKAFDQRTKFDAEHPIELPELRRYVSAGPLNSYAHIK